MELTDLLDDPRHSHVVQHHLGDEHGDITVGVFPDQETARFHLLDWTGQILYYEGVDTLCVTPDKVTFDLSMEETVFSVVHMRVEACQDWACYKLHIQEIREM